MLDGLVLDRYLWKNACSRHVSSYLFASKLSHGLCDFVHIVPYAASEIKRVSCNLQNPNSKKHSHPSDTDWCRLLLSVCALPLIQLQLVYTSWSKHISGPQNRTSRLLHCVGYGARLFSQWGPTHVFQRLSAEVG